MKNFEKYLGIDTINTIANVDDFEFFVYNHETYFNLFGKEVIAQALEDSKTTIANLTKTEYRITDEFFYLDHYPRLSNKAINMPIKEYKGEWSREVNKPCYKYLLPTSYHHKFGAIVKAALLIKFPNLAIFIDKIHCYDINKESDWFYLQCENNDSYNVLYVQYDLFLKGDWEGIWKSHEDYNRGYYRTPSQKAYLDKALAIKDSFICKCFKELVLNMKEGEKTMTLTERAKQEIIKYFGIEEDINAWDVGDINLLNESLNMHWDTDFVNIVTQTMEKYLNSDFVDINDIDKNQIDNLWEQAITANLPIDYGTKF